MPRVRALPPSYVEPREMVRGGEVEGVTLLPGVIMEVMILWIED